MASEVNEQGETVCLKCGVRIVAPMWPFCPHGVPVTAAREDKRSLLGDEIPGGLVLENVGPEPVTVHSYTEMNQLFASRGLQRKETFCPTPGTDHDPAGVQNPRGYMDPVTLANGAELILRGQQAQEEDDFVERAYINRDSHEMSEAEAIQRHQEIDATNRWRRGQ